jgi:hypothetical protein
MSRGQVLLGAVVCLLVSLMPGTIQDGLAQNDNYLSRPTLKGLTGVDVKVEYLRPDIEQAGLTRMTLQTDVELTLREAGIQVVAQPSLSTGNLYLNVDCMNRPPIMIYGCSFQLDLNQPVALARNPQILTLASTWSVGEIYMVGAAYLSTDLPTAVRGLVRQFANAYLEQNPRNP